MKLEPLTIIEGPDCSGKSTLGHQLWPMLGGPDRLSRVHHGPYPLVKRLLPRLYVETMLPMLEAGKGQLWDRAWYSEPIYGAAFRRGEDRVGSVAQRHLERFALRHGAVVILCLPPYEVALEAWKQRKGEEYLDTEDQFRQVYNGYATLPEWCGLPVVVYDHTRHQPELLAQAISASRTGVHPMWHVHAGGSWQARVVLVGDKASDLRDEDCRWRVPFGSFSAQGCSGWLTEQLEAAGIPERQLLWANAEDGLEWLKSRHNQTIVALGKVAAEALSRLGLPFTEVEHPQYHKRFKSGAPYPLIPLLREETA